MFDYKTKHGTSKGKFNIYQSRNGAINLLMANSFITLTLKQVEDLHIDCCELIDFDIDDFQVFYANQIKK